jgi:hypothetical protein
MITTGNSFFWLADFLNLLELPVAAMFVNQSGRNEQFLYRIFHRCFLPSFGSFGEAVPLKPLNQMNRNFVGSIYGRTSIIIAHFVPIH